MFIDQVFVDVQSGHGGSGMAAFRREKFVPKGGPSGGDGGRGGSVYVVAEPQLWTLLDYTYRKRWIAGSGEPGGTSQRTGRSADDLVLPLPPGTVVRDADTGEPIGEVVKPGERLLVAKGGRGGLGNQHFATPTHQAPTEYQPGEGGEKRRIELTLKLIADVGLLGEPNAGKSTLLAAVTAARPKIADYPFTTLEPNLGVVQLSSHRSFVIADIPGIIEGAHAGKGLGLKFLRHVERTRLLVYLIPVDAPDPAGAYDLLRREAEAFSAELAAKPHCVAWTKVDLVPSADELDLPETPEAFAQFVISGVSHSGLEPFLESMWKRLKVERADGD
ncbi:MAG: GTPase ObgE [Gemmatimonadales bacterium]|nr:GTPase ObgE [Gemmatimonadales bacterium]